MTSFSEMVINGYPNSVFSILSHEEALFMLHQGVIVKLPFSREVMFFLSIAITHIKKTQCF